MTHLRTTGTTFAVCSIALIALTLASCGADSGLAAPRVPDADQTPSVATRVLPDAIAGQNYSVMLAAQGGGSAYSWSLAPGAGSLPTGLTLDARGEIFGAASEAGAWAFSVTVTDGAGVGASANLNLTVLDAPSAAPPVLRVVTLSVPDFVAGYNFAASIAAAGSESANYAWTVTGGNAALPPGLALTNTDRRIATVSGVATLAGDYRFEVTADDLSGQTASGAISLRVVAPGAFSLDVQPAALAAAVEGDSYHLTLACDAPGASTCLWNIAAGDLPPGISLDAQGDTHFAKLAGWPTPGSAGTWDFTVSVASECGFTGSRAYSLTVAAGSGALEIVTGELALGSAGAWYEQEIFARGGNPTVPYAWSKVSGQFPQGMTLNPDGMPYAMLAGFPSAAGTYDFEIRVESGAALATRAFSLVVENGAPKWAGTTVLNAPEGRADHVAVWTGATGNPATSHRMIVWGGHDCQTRFPYVQEEYDNGGIYNPAANSWESFPALNAASSPGAPHRRMAHRAVWTGATGNAATSHRMIVWGGTDSAGYFPALGLLNTGSIYDPATDSWTPMSVANAPSRRAYFSMIWTGNTGDPATANRLIVAGGLGGGASGGVYDPLTDTWEQAAAGLAGGPRWVTAATDNIWTGATGNPATSHRTILWGDSNGTFSTSESTGSIYDPLRGVWSATGVAHAPRGRTLHAMVWDDLHNRLIVWGGFDSNDDLQAGAVYDPASGAWSGMSAVNAPISRSGVRAIWAGQYMVVWGGNQMDALSVLSSGGIYDPATDTWAVIPSQNAPAARTGHTMIWTGDTGDPATSNALIVWGGSSKSWPAMNTGGAFRP